MMQCKHAEMTEILDWFEKDHGNEDFWDIDMMLSWVGSDKRILEHIRLPEFIGFWCGTDLCLYLEFANEFHHRWPEVQPRFDWLAKNSSFSIDRDCWEIYN